MAYLDWSDLQSGPFGLVKAFMFGPARKAQRRLEEAQHKAAVAQAIRERGQFVEDAQRQQQEEQQSLAGRGLGISSIMTEQMGFLERAQQRHMDSLNERINISRLQSAAYHTAYRAQQRWGQVDFMVKTTEAMSKAMAGLPPGEDEIPLSQTVGGEGNIQNMGTQYQYQPRANPNLPMYQGESAGNVESLMA